MQKTHPSLVGYLARPTGLPALVGYPSSHVNAIKKNRENLWRDGYHTKVRYLTYPGSPTSVWTGPKKKCIPVGSNMFFIIQNRLCVFEFKAACSHLFLVLFPDFIIVSLLQDSCEWDGCAHCNIRINTPKGDQAGCGLNFLWPLIKTILCLISADHQHSITVTEFLF